MKDELDRLSEAASSDPVGELLRAAKRYKVSEATRQRALTAVGLAGGAAPAANGAAVGHAAGWKILGLLVGAGVVGVLLVGGLRLSSRRASEGVQAPVTPTPSVVAVSAPPTEPVAPVSASASAFEPSPVASSASVSAPPKRAVASSASHGPMQVGDLAAELAALDAASSTLVRGDAAGALALLDAYWRDHPHGSLALEATVLQAEALERAGRHGEAVEKARGFLKRYPTSPLAERMRHIVGE
jgi:hypothetical protein